MLLILTQEDDVENHAESCRVVDTLLTGVRKLKGGPRDMVQTTVSAGDLNPHVAAIGFV
jgi:hypothetical protein